jgi:DNA-binding MarR family transcriptional regulator
LQVTHERLKDSRGGLIPTVVANPIGEIAQEEMVAAARSQEDQLLLQISATPSATQPDLARSLGWFMRDGAPAKMRVKRAIDKLEAAKLLKRDRDGVTLTPSSENAIAKLTPTKPKQED